jgi:hypothetical protein
MKVDFINDAFEYSEAAFFVGDLMRQVPHRAADRKIKSVGSECCEFYERVQHLFVELMIEDDLSSHS